MPTSRIETVRDCEIDCPQNNPLSKRARIFDSRQVLALLNPVLANRFNFPQNSLQNQ